MADLLQSSPGKRPPPLIPEGCEDCPIGTQTICRPAFLRDPAIVEDFKIGDRVIPPKRPLYHQGEYSPELYNLLDGWVMLHVILESGVRQIIDIALPGAFIGYQSDPAAPMRHSAEALTPVSVCVFPRRHFQKFLTEHTALAIRLNEILARDLERSRALAVNLGSRMALASLANLLVTLYVRSRASFPEPAGPDTAFLPLTQEQLASIIGTSSVHVSNLLKQFRQKGLAEFRTPILTIKDYDRLLEIASFEEDFEEIF